MIKPLQVLSSINDINLKLQKADVKLLCGDGVKAIMKYNQPNLLNISDTLYIKSEIYFKDIDNFAKRHQEMARAIYASKCHFLYYCRITCTKGYSGKRENGDAIIKGIIDDLYRAKRYYCHVQKLEDDVTEFMISNFETRLSIPYI